MEMMDDGFWAIVSENKRAAMMMVGLIEMMMKIIRLLSLCVVGMTLNNHMIKKIEPDGQTDGHTGNPA